MSRSINDSVTQLETSLDECKTSLTNKSVEVVAERPKVSELPALIDSIQAGGGSSSGGLFNNIDYIEIPNGYPFPWYNCTNPTEEVPDNQKYTTNGASAGYDYAANKSYKNITLKVKTSNSTTNMIILLCDNAVNSTSAVSSSVLNFSASPPINKDTPYRSHIEKDVDCTVTITSSISRSSSSGVVILIFYDNGYRNRFDDPFDFFCIQLIDTTE